MISAELKTRERVTKSSFQTQILDVFERGLLWWSFGET